MPHDTALAAPAHATGPTPPTSRRARLRRAALVAGTACAGTVAATVLTATPAYAHHGWDEFDTTTAYYISGTVSDVRWGDPHSSLTLTLDPAAEVPPGWLDRQLPEDADEQDEATMASTRSYDGDQTELHLVLAGPGYMETWGLEQPLQDGQWIEATGYVNGNHDDEYRPTAFWLEDGQVVQQRLTSLPDDPEPNPALQADGGGSAGDGAAAGGGTAEQADDAVAASQVHPSATTWTIVGLGALIVVAGGTWYVRRRTATATRG